MSGEDGGGKADAASAAAAAAEGDGPPPGFGAAEEAPTTTSKAADGGGSAKEEEEKRSEPPAPATAADDDGDGDGDAPPGFPAADADALAAGLAAVKPAADDPDEPDLALAGRLSGLREDPAAKISVAHADDGDGHDHDFAALYRSATAFEELPISAELLQGIYTEMKFERPSRIQALTLPMILTPDGHGRLRDLIAQAHNGSGKTTCFALSMLSRVDPAVPHTQALCMCPTRELVVQNLSVLRRMAKYTAITSTSTAVDDAEGAAGAGAGGGSGPPVRRTQRIAEHVVVGTHGRLKTWVTKKILDIDHVRILVFDEADEMLKGDAFADDTVRLIKTIRRRNPDVQLLLFSATFNDQIRGFALKIAPKANQVFVPKEELSLEVIAQYSVRVPTPGDKAAVLKNMIFPNCEKLGQTIIFVRTRAEARALHAAMEAEGYRCTSITGDMQMADRDRVVREFREGATKILISTDVLSRGFDVSQVTLVVNYDAPVERDQRTPNYETYLHRIGRSGRFGRRGAAFNLVAGEEDARVVSAIARYFARDIPDVPWDDEEAFIGVLRKAGLTDQT